MCWTIVTHPETGGVGVIAESALRGHLNVGWLQREPADWSEDPDELRALLAAEAAEADRAAHARRTPSVDQEPAFDVDNDTDSAIEQEE
jgi:hypothetical protein